MQLPNYLIKTLCVLNVMFFFSLASARRRLKAWGTMGNMQCR